MRAIVAIATALALAACERTEPMRRLADPCAGEKVALARNSSTRGIELYARFDTGGALLVGVVPPNGRGEYRLPDGVTGVFVFPGAGGGKSQPPIAVSYRCDLGRPRPVEGRTS